MLRRKNKKKMSIHIWKYFTIFSVIIMITLWILQIILFNGYFETMKIKELCEIGDNVISHYGEVDFDTYVEKISFVQGISVGVFDENKNILHRSDTHEFKVDNNSSSNGNDNGNNRWNKEFYKGTKHIEEKDIEKVINKLENDKTDSVTITEKHRGFGKMITYATRKDTGNGYVYVYVKSALPPTNHTIDVLRGQLIMVTVLSLVIAFILSYFFSKRLTRPIVNITKSAERLAEGDYSATFESSDYIEIDRLSKVLNNATEEIQKTEEMRNDLMANVSHDLRTPLTIIKSYAEMIRDLSGENPEKREQHTNVIIKETDRLSLIVTDMLDLSKLDAGTYTKVTKEFSVSDLVKSAMNSFDVVAERDGYKLKSDIEDDCNVNADEKMLSRAIYNLISNAVNYTGDDKEIYIKLCKTDDNKVRFSVTDTGKGIDDKDKEFVWDRYYKSSRTHTREVEGTGLGLSIVKNILEVHNATYGVDSKVGCGSTFWFEIDSI